MLMAVPAEAQLNQTRHTDGWILAAAHAPGLQGSIWRTDLWIVRGSEGGEVRLTFCEQNTDNTNAEEYDVMFEEGDLVAFVEEAVDTFLGIGDGSWTGAIHYTAAFPVQVWARVYSVNAEGTESYGQIIEGIPTADMTPDNDPWNSLEQQYLFAVKHTADNRYRVNIGVVNPTSIEAQYQVAAYGGDGNCPPGGCDWFDVTVPPYSMVQQQDPFADWQGGAWDEVSIQAQCQTDGAGVFVYASVVDNATNDAFFVRGVKRQQPGD
jgi:hypothetical protein